MNRANDLLERALRDLDLNNRPHSTYLAEEIRAYLAEPEVKHDQRKRPAQPGA
jgi:hypothetical protein